MFAVRLTQICSRSTAIRVGAPFCKPCISTSLHKLSILRLENHARTICSRAGSSAFLQCKRFAASKTSADSGNLSGRNRIYYGPLTPRMKAVKVFSLTTSLVGLAAQPIFMEQGVKLGGTGMAIFLCSFVGFFTFVTPLLLHFIMKKYVTEIHYNPDVDEYTATTISLLLYKVQTKFRTTDVKVPDVPGMFTSFLIRDKPFFVDPAQFNDPEHYVRIMGYDKPIDFKLNSETKSGKVK